MIRPRSLAVLLDTLYTLSKDEILRVEASFSGSKRSLLVEFLNLGIERVERGAERVRHGVVYRQESGPVRAEDPEVELGIEEGDFEAVGGRGIAVRLGNAMDHTFES
jgi:hypothetical protein